MENKTPPDTGTSLRFGEDNVFAKANYVPPDMTVFGVPESDLDSLCDIGFTANVYLAATSGLLTAALSCVVAGMTADGVTRSALYIGGMVMVLLGIGAGLITRNELNRKDRLIDRIKRHKVKP